jgi:hypothetical protein
MEAKVTKLITSVIIYDFTPSLLTFDILSQVALGSLGAGTQGGGGRAAPPRLLATKTGFAS